MKFTVVLLLVFLPLTVYAYNDRSDFGTTSDALAGADVADPSFGAGLSLNPVVNSSEYRLTASFHYMNIYGIPGLNSNLMTIRYYPGKLSFGLEYGFFGKSELYSENNFRFSASYLGRDYYLGLILSRLSLNIGDISDYGNYSSLGFSWGYRKDSYGIGAVVNGFNIGSKNIGVSEVRRLYSVGLYYKVREFTSLFVGFYLNGSDGSVSIGQSFILNKLISLQIGLKSNPTTPSFGVLIREGIFGIAYSYSYHTTLGDTHQLGLTVGLSKSKGDNASN